MGVVDGLRIDTALNAGETFFPDFVDAAAVFSIGEVLFPNVQDACPWQHAIGGILNYPTYYPLTRAFNTTNGSIVDLAATIVETNKLCENVHVLGTFSENHDVPRFASYTGDMSLAQNILTFVLLADGIPIVYNGQEQHYDGAYNPVNREAIWLSRYNLESPLAVLTTALNGFRKLAIDSDPNYLKYVGYPIYSDEHVIGLRKGFNGSQVITILNNQGASGPSYDLTLSGAATGFKTGDSVMEILTCKNLTAGAGGDVALPMFRGLPKVLFPSTLLAKSSICKDGKATIPKSSSGSPTVTHSPSKTATSSADKTKGRSHNVLSCLLFPGLAATYLL